MKENVLFSVNIVQNIPKLEVKSENTYYFEKKKKVCYLSVILVVGIIIMQFTQKTKNTKVVLISFYFTHCERKQKY